MREAAVRVVEGAVEAGASPLSLDALGDMAAGLATVERRVALLPEHDPSSPRSLRLIATDAYDVWLISWPAGSGLDEHDHATATGVLRLVHGLLVESVGDRRRQLRPGVSAVLPPYTAHRLSNPTTEEVTTIHVYTPPLAAVTYYRPTAATSLHPAGRDLVSRTRRLAPRPAEAISR